MTGRIEVSFASFEAPEAATGRIEIAWAAFEAPEVTQSTGGGSYNQYSRATGRLKFEIPRLPLRPKPKGKKKQEPEQVAADSLQYIAEQLKLPESPPYADELLALFVDLIEKQKQLTERQRQREMVAAFLEMEEMEAEAELLLLAH